MKTSTILIGAAVAVAGYFAYQHFKAPAKATTANAAASTSPTAGGWLSLSAWRSVLTGGTAATSTTSSSSPPASTERVAMANAGGVDITSWPEVAA